jgi:predicted metal-dependent hydrolase
VLQYNWLIMLAPYSIIDYMIAHEVCHLIHMDHSKRFWLLVNSVCPEHEQYIRWLKEHEHRFWF